MGDFVMFTGIVQSTGTVRTIQHGSHGIRLNIDAPDLPRPIHHGSSVCVNGVCLTVTHSDARAITFDVIPETLSRSTLRDWRPGRRVNLEPSLRAGDAMDGHVVQGHVDGRARVAEVTRERGGQVWTFQAGDDFMPFVIPKGSIAIDGVSLTIADVTVDRFSVALIPTTLELTTLGDLVVGDEVNIETDIVARTIVTTLQRWRGGSHEPGLTVEMLREQGFA